MKRFKKFTKYFSTILTIIGFSGILYATSIEEAKKMFGNQAINELKLVEKKPDGFKEKYLIAGILANNISVTPEIDTPKIYTDKAFKYLKKYLEEKPNYNLAIFYMGNVHTLVARDSKNPFTKMSKAKSGFKLMDSALQKDPKNILFHLIRGSNSLSLPEFFKRLPKADEDARIIYQSLKKKENKLGSIVPDLYWFLGKYYERKSNYKKGKMFYNALIKKFPKSRVADLARERLKKIP